MSVMMSLHVVVLTYVLVVVLSAMLLTVMAVRPLRSVHVSSLVWARTILLSEER